MLRLVNIDKTYKVASSDVKALKKVNLSFRKNEFVSVLGPSGSGKTTLLNIIGGLDKYTDGDLIIAGKSTKDFKDRDWDFYRNQRIGFIFQAYNLIPHQNVLSNVELALTISGISKTERVARAKEALDKVGLSDQYYKKPNQLSGGQCQRVAIARALVNNPEILLADEPTGALDTKTSEQIMDLIKEISKDRLVIMVTHNPDLAERYSTRIIRLLDGEIVEDSRPFKDEDEVKEVASLKEETVDKKSKAKMGLWTATKLSFKNLISKKGRTILVSIASSIGIIGVSTVLAVSFGVTGYVNGMQDDMLSSYPLEIAEKSIDLSSLISGLSNSQKAELAKFDVSNQVGMQSMIDYLMDKYSDVTNIKTNEINDLLMKYIDELPSSDVAAKKYDYGIDVTNNIFVKWTDSEKEGNNTKYVSANGLTQRYISELKTVNGFSTYASYVDLFTNFMKEMPGDEEYILNQYDLLGNSTFATEANQMMLVVSKDTTLTDLLLGQLGFYNHDEFIHIGQKAVEIYKKGEKVEDKGLKQQLTEKLITQAEYDEKLSELSKKYPYRQIFNYTDLIGRDFYYFPHETIWGYGNVSDDTSMTGTIILKNDNYLFYLTFQNLLGNDALVGLKADLKSATAQPETIAFIRNPSPSRDPNTFFDGLWYEFSTSTYKATGGGMNVSTAAKAATYIPNLQNPSIFEAFVNANITAEETGKTIGFNYPIEGKEEWRNDLDTYKGMKVTISGILRAKEDTNFGSLSRGIYYNNKLATKYMNDAVSENSTIYNGASETTGIGIKTLHDINQAKTTTFKAYCTYQYLDYTNSDDPTIKTNGYSSALNGDLSTSMGSLFSSAIGSSSIESTNQVYLRSLSGMKASYNDDTADYTITHLPQNISIYPKDFASKDNVTQKLDEWNKDVTLTIGGNQYTKEQRGGDISYTDTVAMIISVINTLITIVTSALVAFTSLSLVVSCFMIAVITYISVMERVKEIGVIRSLGGRKKDVNRLFTAENFMTGLASGLIGIVVTYLLSGLINIIVSFFGVTAIAALPWWMAIIMVALSIFLNVISGFIPSRNAAKQDPVNALRSE
ncbi:MAG: ABC transporter ATP-binding protein/permease [Bacilli bacterium]|nr:ABC transporter ATP-binding protein/permease [Bacilli bacterium]